ncbi:MAG TPA: hypothetical protein VH912_05125 [Streptosporangiaceae bacterium]|jgi:hypothetical protein
MALRTVLRADSDGGGGGDDAADGPIASHAGAMISALFLLIFAIAVIVPWTVADSARQNTYAEANALVEAGWAARGLPPADAASTRTALRDYVRFVAEKEWRGPQQGEPDPQGWQRLDKLRAALAGLRLENEDQQDARDDVQSQLQTVYAARRQRAVDAHASLPTGVLALTVLTAVLVAAFPVLSGARPRGWIWAPYALLGVSLAVGVYLVFAINHTFSGPLGVAPTAFTAALQELGRIP